MSYEEQSSSLSDSGEIVARHLHLHEIWVELDRDEQMRAFHQLDPASANDFFLSLKTKEQAALVLAMPAGERRLWVRMLPPDDLADVIQAMPEQRASLLELLGPRARKDVVALLAYREDEAGGLMSPYFVRVRPDMRVDEALAYVRQQAKNAETTRYAFIIDAESRLLGVVSLRSLFANDGDAIVSSIMRTSVISVTDTMSQEEIAKLFVKTGLKAIPVVGPEGRIKGIITVDDIVQVVAEEATEDIHRLGGLGGLDDPYLDTGMLQLIKKRAGWLVVLFVGEMLTATAMAHFGPELERAIVLALFIPLIISSGGNSGSQASTLVVRAIALGEVRLRDWWRVLMRELLIGTSLGAILGTLGLLRILVWPGRETLYGEHFFLVGLTVAISLVGIVLWGSVSGSMLPFLLKRLRLDPATASAPFVATLVDVSGLVIYFTVAALILRGTLL